MSRGKRPASNDDADARVTATTPITVEEAGDSAFTPGDTIADRYHVRRFIAFGAMGEVYEAEDLALRERVALKTIRADVADDPTVLDRFKREILLARKVTHVNVCRIFDLGVHVTPGRERPQPFLTMELLDGQTLSDRLRMGRRFTVAEARPIVEQMAAALAAAHREGIIHRDFKSGNVMLCPATDARGGVRAVVTDFGLARRGAGDPFATEATGATGMIGSPAYMSPEQVEGEHIAEAADVYALGVVMFEMLTGHVPFTGESPMACAVKRIKGPAPSPREHLPDLDARWEATILRCLERDAANRFASASDVVRALDGLAVAPPAGREAPDHAAPRPEPAPAPEPEPPVVPAKPRPRRWPFVAAAAAAAALASGGAWSTWRARQAPAPAVAVEEPASGARRSIAVLGFKNLARRDDVAWLSTALAEMLTTEMGAGGELRTIPGESLARMKKELALEDAESYAPDTLRRIHKNILADYVVVGSYAPFGAQLRLDVRLQNAATGETLVQVRETGTEAELTAVVEKTGAKLRERLRVGQLGEGEVALVQASLPRDPEAARLYADGLGKQRLYLATQAREALEQAIELEPSFPQAHAALSEALQYLGFEARAREEARRAMELSASLPEDERLRVEGAYHTISGDTARAAETYRKLWERSPDNLEWGMRLARAQFSAGDDAAGHATVALLRANPHAEDDPRLYMVLVQAAMMRASFGEVREQAAKMAATGEARGALSLVGEGKQFESMAMWFQGELPAAAASADQARQLSFRLGDRDGFAAASTTKAFVLSELGRHAEARQAALAALEAAAEVGSRRRIWLAEHVLGRCGLFTGDLGESMRRMESSRAAAEEVGSRYGNALALLGLAVTHATQGELARAEPIYDRMSLGFRLFAPKHNQAFFRFYRGTLELAQGDLEEARAAFAEALQLAGSFGERMRAERARLGLGNVALARGLGEEAEAQARAAREAFRELGLDDDAALAGATLARALLRQGREADAEAAMAAASGAAQKTENVFVRFALARTRAELLHAAHRPSAAVELLTPVAEDAAARGYVGEALELRLVRAQALADIARDDGQRELEAVYKEAARLGFATLARRAQTASVR